MDPGYTKAFEEWSAAPTPIYDEFKVDWKKLHASSDTPEARRINDMLGSQMEKLKRAYPKFDFSKASWPAGNNMVQLPSWIGQYLAAFQNAERWAITGFESPAHLLGADNESKRKAMELAKAHAAQLKNRENELKGLFGGKTRKTKKSKRTRKTKTRARK